MKTALVIAIPGGIFATGVMWWLGEHLSSDAIGMALGLAFGVLAGLPAAALVLVASRRGGSGDDQPVQVYGLMNRDHINLRGGGFDGVYLKAPVGWPEVQAEPDDHQIVRVQPCHHP